MIKIFYLTILLLPYIAVGQLDSPYNIGTAPIQANPAFTGINSYGDLNLNYRTNRFMYNLQDVSFTTHLPSVNSGIGIIITNRNFNWDYNSFSTGIAYSYQTKLGEKLHLSLGLSGYHQTYSIKSDFENTTLFTSNIFSLNGGALLYNERFFASFALLDNQFGYKYIYISGITGYELRFKKTESFSITPTLSFIFEKGFYNLSSRVNFNYKEFKAIIGAEETGVVTGLGYVNNNWGVHYMLYIYTHQLATSIGEHRISCQLKLPN